MAAKGKGNTQDLTFRILGDVKGLEKTTIAMMRIINSFVKKINKSFSNIGKLQKITAEASKIPIEGYSRIEEQRERISPEKTKEQKEATLEDFKSKRKKLEAERLEITEKINKLEHERDTLIGDKRTKAYKNVVAVLNKEIENQKNLLDINTANSKMAWDNMKETMKLIRMQERQYQLGAPVISSKTYTDKNKSVEETTREQYYYSGKIARTVDGQKVKLLQKEKTITQKVKDLNTGNVETLQRVVVEQQRLVSGNRLIWETVDGTAKKTTELNAETEKYREKMNSIKKPVEVLEEKLRRVKETLKQQGLSEDKINSLTAQRLNLEKQIEKLKKPKKTFFSTLFERFKSVAIYRTIRNVLKEIVNAFKESLSGIAMKSDAFNESFSKITSSIEQVKASMGVAFYQVLIVLEPVITNLSNLVVNFANGISYLMAKVSGSNTYLKVNTEYLKNYRDAMQGTLLEFDDFTTLSSNQNMDYDKMFEEVKTDTADWTKELEGAIAPLTTILTLMTLIFGPKMFKWIKEIGTGIKTFYTSGIMPMASVLSGAFLILDGILGIINWDESTHWLTKVLDLVKLIAGALAVVFGIWSMITHGAVGWVKAVAGIAAAVGLAATVTSGITGYANGGNFRTGDFFVANENGNTELIASSNSGGGSVMNLDQWAQISEASFFNALSKYDAAQNGQSGGLDIDKLGTAIARSNGFRNEINRRNVGLNLV